MINEKTLVRFWKKVNKSGDCWEWTATRDRDGYGIFCISANTKPNTVKSHRFSALIAGIDIDNKVVRHMCNNPACVNPAHLKSGSQADNVQDMMQAQRQNIIGRPGTPISTPYGDFNSIKEAAIALNLKPATIVGRLNRNNAGWRRK